MIRSIGKHAWRRGRPLATLALIAVGAWFCLRSGLGSVLGQAARSVGAPAYEALAAVDPERVDLLVTNALDADQSVARPARIALGGVVDRWIVRARIGAESERVRDQLLALQQELVSRLDQLTPSGAGWIEHLGDHFLRAAEGLAVSDRVAVVEGTSALLDAVARTTLQAESPAPTAIDEPTVAERSVAEPLDEPRLWIIPDRLRVDTSSRDDTALAPRPPAALSEPTGWRADWQAAAPSERIKPAPLPASAPSEAAPLGRPANTLTDRELIAELLSVGERQTANPQAKRPDGQGPQALGPVARRDDEATRRYEALTAELRARGFRSLRADHARLFVSSKATDRRRLAERLLSEGGETGVRMALQLARDAEAPVRRAAIETLAASPYPDVVREAFAIAVRDPHPSVASLSEALRLRLR
ncbi:MAG: hypothetical protein AAFV43_00340 [Planctomycetota bacterium]